MQRNANCLTVGGVNESLVSAVRLLRTVRQAPDVASGARAYVVRFRRCEAVDHGGGRRKRSLNATATGWPVCI